MAEFEPKQREALEQNFFSDGEPASQRGARAIHEFLTTSRLGPGWH